MDVLKILYICTHNRCRSIISEAILNKYGSPLIVAASAGSRPEGEVHPLTLAALKRHGYPTASLKSQSWHEFASFDPDFVITVCDKAASEPCPLWIEKGKRLHWALPDPSKGSSIDCENTEAFDCLIDALEKQSEKMANYCRTIQSKEALLDAIRNMEKIEVSNSIASERPAR